jgi:O-antigen/teichoic acid export membrane protein
MTRLIQKAKISSIYTLLGNIWEQSAKILIIWLLVKNLSVEEFGIYNLLLGTSAFLGIVSSLGLISAFKRYLPEFFQKKEYRKFLWTVKYGSAFRASTAIISVSLIVLLFDKVGPFLQIGDYQNYFLIFAIGLFFLLQANLLEKALEAMFLHKYVVYALTTHTIIRFSLLYIIFYFEYGLLQVFVVDLITYLALLGLCLYFYKLNDVRKTAEDIGHQNFSKSALMKRLLRYSGFSMFNEAGKVVLDISTDFLVISHFLGPHVLGYYAFAARFGRIISKFLPTRMMRKVIFPVFIARYAESGDKKELDRMFNFLAKINAFLLFPVITLVAVFGRDIIQYVFDPKYLEGYTVMIILLVYFAMWSLPVGLPLKAVEKPEFVLLAKLSSIYNLIMDIVLIQFWGILGVAIATSSAIIIKKIFEYNLSKKFAGITFPWVGIFKIILNCFILGTLMAWAKQFVDSILSLALISVLGMFAYLGISCVNKVFKAEERSLINKLVGRPYFIF